MNWLTKLFGYKDDQKSPYIFKPMTPVRWLETEDDLAGAVKVAIGAGKKVYPDWISVDDQMPENGIRVWASSGPQDIGNDCYFGQKSVTFGEIQETGKLDFGENTWRYSLSQLPVVRPITHWMPLPSPPTGY